MTVETQALMAAAKKLVESVEFDVNGIHGKGGNGGLTSDRTLRASGEVRIILDRLKK
ncbi:hypothetical protein [Rhizobium sp. Root1203]|uniref:hypothetical protein n=1 Tax=Rhizobium sp. Root1203 TaxID=1736427 RepID=UPI0012E392E7|nr:hypothetical protein [Rhizobium sp. Root1203]